mmetsp:Transcript_17875/g.27358  ORF Transcript_17875/g.27358 Transcript_17875/m.27358 type:complete len:109 (+) Transcript_17875:149-475(+)
MSEHNKSTQATQLKALQNRERQRITARKINLVRQKLHKSGISMLESTDDHGNPKTQFNKEDIEHAIMASNQKKFKKAHNTPFLQQPLLDKVGKSDSGLIADKILQGIW